MKITCDYCSNTYEDTAPECPNCGAPNPTHKSDNNPKTIEDLKVWYRNRGLPSYETTRFFIGIDYKQPKAFGIYKNADGDFVVYKNKADGTRAIRYQGKDEIYAVNELFQKLKDEIVHQKNMNRTRSSRPPRYSSTRGGGNKLVKYIIIGWFIFIIGNILISNLVTSFNNRHNGYYSYNGDTYYHYGNHWYIYDAALADYGYETSDFSDSFWLEVDNNKNTDVIESNYDDYYISKSWDSSIDATDWNNTNYYTDTHTSSYSDSDSDWSDYSWDSSDSWDSGGSDWDSDW